MSLQRGPLIKTSLLSTTSLGNAMELTSTDIPLGQDGKRKFRLHHLKPTGGDKTTGGGRAVLFVPGFLSSSKGTKARYLSEYCRENRLEFISYDPESLGDSSPLRDPAGLEFRHWVENAEAALEKAGGDRVLVVGSSMGGMIALKLALLYPDKVDRLLLIAPAVNLLYEKYIKMRESVLDEKSLEILDKGGILPPETLFAERQGQNLTFPVRAAFFENMKNEEHLDLSRPLPVKAKVRILHGVKDDAVPFERSLDLMALIESEDVDLVYRKNGEHRMSSEDDLQLMIKHLEELLV